MRLLSLFYPKTAVFPREKWVGKLIEYKAMKIKINENGKERFVALHRGKLVNQSDIEILARYNAEVRGLYNYYSIANDSFKIGRFANVSTLEGRHGVYALIDKSERKKEMKQSPPSVRAQLQTEKSPKVPKKTAKSKHHELEV